MSYKVWLPRAEGEGGLQLWGASRHTGVVGCCTGVAGGWEEDQLSLGPILGGSVPNQPLQGLFSEAPDVSRGHTELWLGPPPSGLALAREGRGWGPEARSGRSYGPLAFLGTLLFEHTDPQTS